MPFGVGGGFVGDIYSDGKYGDGYLFSGGAYTGGSGSRGSTEGYNRLMAMFSENKRQASIVADLAEVAAAEATALAAVAANKPDVAVEQYVSFVRAPEIEGAAMIASQEGQLGTVSKSESREIVARAAVSAETVPEREGYKYSAYELQQQLVAQYSQELEEAKRYNAPVREVIEDSIVSDGNSAYTFLRQSPDIVAIALQTVADTTRMEYTGRDPRAGMNEYKLAGEVWVMAYLGGTVLGLLRYGDYVFMQRSAPPEVAARMKARIQEEPGVPFQDTRFGPTRRNSGGGSQPALDYYRRKYFDPETHGAGGQFGSGISADIGRATIGSVIDWLMPDDVELELYEAMVGAEAGSRVAGVVLQGLMDRFLDLPGYMNDFLALP